MCYIRWISEGFEDKRKVLACLLLRTMENKREMAKSTCYHQSGPLLYTINGILSQVHFEFMNSIVW